MTQVSRTRVASPLIAAIGFLTRVPVRTNSDPGRGAALFPVVGAAIGAIVGGTALGLAQVLPPLVSAGCALIVGTLLTGALHIDGLADTADALAANTRERAFAVMRDHSTGAYGTAAVALDLIVKASALAALANRRSIVVYALTAGALSRAVPVVLAGVSPRARDDGIGAAFRVTPRQAVVASLLAVVLAFSANGFLILFALVAAVVLDSWYRRWLGGVTGDTLGAATELTETMLLVAAVALR